MAKDVKITLDAETSAYNSKMKVANQATKTISKNAKKSGNEWTKQIPILGRLNSLMGEGIIKAGGIALAVVGIAKAWTMVQREREKAQQANLSSTGGRKLLAQVAGSQQEAIELESMAFMLAATGGISEDEASRVVFSLKSGNNLAQFETVRQLSKIDPNLGQTIIGAQTSAAAFGGDLTTSVNRLLAGSKQSKFSLAQIAGGVATAGGEFAAKGGTEAQLLALIGGDESVKTADIAGTEIRAFAAATVKDPILSKFNSGGGPLDTARNLLNHMSEKKIPLSDVGRFIGSEEAQRGFRIIVNNIKTGTLKKRIAELQLPGDVIGQAVSNRSPNLIVAENFRTTEAVLSLRNRNAGIAETRQESINNLNQADLTDRNFITRGAGAALGFVADIFDDFGREVADEVIEARSMNLMNRATLDIQQKQLNTLERQEAAQANKPALGVKD